MNDTNANGQTRQASRTPVSLVTDDQAQSQSKTSSPISVSSDKESEAFSTASSEVIKSVSSEVELPKEVAEAGVEYYPESVEVPPDLKKIGVQQTGSSAPAPTADDTQKVKLPISDQIVIKGLHESLLNSLHWLAVWSIRKLQKAHLILKIVHGKVIRIKE